jgi:hypothetical protein
MYFHMQELFPCLMDRLHSPAITISGHLNKEIMSIIRKTCSIPIRGAFFIDRGVEMRIAAVLVILIMAAGTPAAAQSAAFLDDWSRISMISAGEELLLRLEDGQRIEGRFVSATRLTIQLHLKEKIVSFDSTSVVQVCRRRPRHMGRSALLGSAAGAVAGYMAAAESWNDGASAAEGAKHVAISIPVGAAVGALVGFFLGMKKSAWELIYEKQANFQLGQALRRRPHDGVFRLQLSDSNG